MKALLIVFGFALLSCTAVVKNEDILKSDSVSTPLPQVELNKLDTIFQKTPEKFMDTMIYGKRWSEIESSGDPDTALTLFAYRIIFTEDKEAADDCLSLMNVLLNTKQTKRLMKTIFSTSKNVHNFDTSIDSLNVVSVLHAKEKVKNEIEEFGESDEGPCFELSNIK